MAALPTAGAAGSAMDTAEVGGDGAVIIMCLDGVNNAMDQLPAMKRARSELMADAPLHSAASQRVWQVCLAESWRGAGAVGYGEGGATWVDVEGGWQRALELLHYSTLSLGEDVWKVVMTLGPTAYPRAQLQGLGYPSVEYVRAPPGTRQGGDFFQRNTASGTERTVRCVKLLVGPLVGKVAFGTTAAPTLPGGESAAGSAALMG
jgi:hypothetical protein